MDTDCLEGTQAFNRHHDTEDSHNANTSTGNLGPNVVTKNATLEYCFVPADVNSTLEYPFAKEYGVFANYSSTNIVHSKIFMDDEDSDNANSWGWYCQLPIFVSFPIIFFYSLRGICERKYTLPVNTELVFDAANVNATVFLRPLGSIARRTYGFASLSHTRLVNTSRFVLTVVVDEHGKAAAVVGAFFGAGEHQVNVAVAVGDEALHAVQVPALVFFAVGGLEHHALSYYGRGRFPPGSHFVALHPL